MSEYTAFFAIDFASRCRDLLRHFYLPAKARDREVTLLVAVASAGLVVPLERLVPGQGQPTLDRSSYGSEAGQLERLLDESISASALAGGCGVWNGALLRSAEGLPDQWPEMRSEEELPGTTKLRQLVYWLRHALAHGNITTRVGAKRTISRLVFVCGYENPQNPKQERQPLRYVSVTPDGLHAFLVRWFERLAELGVSRDVLAELLNADEAA